MVTIATAAEWPSLQAFFQRIYPSHHPLQNFDFWYWQYGDPAYGRSFIFYDEEGLIAGHVGATFGGGFAWIINVYLDEQCRGKGILAKLYAMARDFYPIAATSANNAGLGLYRNMHWIRYCDLQRFVAVNPVFLQDPTDVLLQQSGLIEQIVIPGGHYWRQPGITGHRFSDGSTAVLQPEVAGLRAVDIVQANSLQEEAWSKGFHWIDYVTSWNDPLCRQLEQMGWLPDHMATVPWRLNPVEPGSKCWITYLSENHMPRDFIVHRSYSDHGRVGRLGISATK